jgi:hypothetical protein
MRVQVACLATVSLFSCASAGTTFNGPRSYPQFRDISGFAGGTFGVDESGKLGIDGAMAISTPIGFALGHRRIVLGLGSLSRDSFLALPNLDRNGNAFESDASGQIVAGVDTPVGRINYTHFVLSSLLDSVGNMQWQLPIRSSRLGLSIGAQNVWGRSGQSAEEYDPTNGDNSRSVFAVATYKVAPGAYATLGVGDFRFKGVFGSACANVAPRTKAVVEYDTFGWNVGVGHSLGRIKGVGRFSDRSEVTLFGGMILGKRALLAVNFGF